MTSFADTKAVHVPARKLGAKKNQIIQLEQFGDITLSSCLLFSLSDWIFFSKADKGSPHLGTSAKFLLKQMGEL